MATESGESDPPGGFESELQGLAEEALRAATAAAARERELEDEPPGPADRAEGVVEDPFDEEDAAARALARLEAELAVTDEQS